VQLRLLELGPLALLIGSAIACSTATPGGSTAATTTAATAGTAATAAATTTAGTAATTTTAATAGTAATTTTAATAGTAATTTTAGTAATTTTAGTAATTTTSGTAATTTTVSVSTTAGHSHEHDHDHHDHGAASAIHLDELVDPPTIEATAEPDGAGGILVAIDLSGIQLVDATEPLDHRPGEGHLHVLLDGKTVAMTIETSIHLQDLADGHHEVTVAIASNDHRDYFLDGSPIQDVAAVMVSGGRAPVVVDRTFSVTVAGGNVVGGVPRFEASLGDLVDIVVTSDVDDEVHLHAYDMTVDVEAGGEAAFRVEATIPGVFEAELHDAGFRIFELQVS